jgi:hypothetical protein
VTSPSISGRGVTQEVGYINVGINRPDLQYTLNGRRHYVEYEILAIDPNAVFLLRRVP